jgi:DnaJ-class molecular chaperone
MKFNPFKILAGIASAIPIVKTIWYSVKMDVPRVICDRCVGCGQINGVKCSKCNGSGKMRSTEAR